MTKKLSFPLIIIGVAILIILGNSLFVVTQVQQAIVLQFGERVAVYQEPGLKIKIPFIQEVLYFEKRVLDYDLPPVPVTTEDQKRLIVNAYTRYKIEAPVLFFKSIKPANEMGARLRLEAIISSILRNVMGRVELRRLLSQDRSKVMNEIENAVRIECKPLGISIVDVRIIRTELPAENRQAVFAQMNSGLILIAKKNRANGSEVAQETRAKANRERTFILATSEKESKMIRGEGRSKAMKIAADAHKKDPKFYNFIKSMEVYKDALAQDSNIVLSTSNDLFRFFSDPKKQMK